MPKKIKQKNKKGAVKKSAQSKTENRTRTIEVNVVTDSINNYESKPKSKPKKKKNLKTNKIKPKVKKVNKVKSKKSGKILKGLGILILIAGAIVFICTTPLFNVTQIDVIGNETVSNDEIISLSQIKLNDNMFKNVKSKIKQNIKGNAYIEDVTVKRVLPNKIQITVQERKVKFMVKLLESYAYINSQGYILEITNQTKEVPVLEGISTPAEELTIGKRLNDEDLNKLEFALNVISNCEENEISRFISSINLENSNDYTIYMGEKTKKIHLGNDTNISTKILYVKAILEAEEGNEGEIFVNGDLNKGFQPYFRKKV